MSAEQGEFLRCAGMLCLIQPRDLGTPGPTGEHLEWEKNSVSRALQSPGCSEAQDYTIPRGWNLPLLPWTSFWLTWADLGCLEWPKGQPCPPASATWKPAQGPCHPGHSWTSTLSLFYLSHLKRLGYITNNFGLFVFGSFVSKSVEVQH